MDKNVIKDMRLTIPDGATAVMGKDRIFFLHPTRRYAPAIPMMLMAAGTAMQVQATRQQGNDAEELANQRAAIDMANADAARKSSVEEAKLRGDQGRRLLATQKSQFAAGNVRINVGDPLVIERETQGLIAQDIGYVLEGGRTQSDAYRSSAALEIATGKKARKQSRSTALAQGLSGLGSMGMAGYKAGWFSKSPGTGLPKVGTVTPQAGATLARY